MYSSGGDLHLELPTGQQGGTRKLWVSVSTVFHWCTHVRPIILLIHETVFDSYHLKKFWMAVL